MKTVLAARRAAEPIPYNFMPWSLADFNNKLWWGLRERVRGWFIAPNGLADIKNDGSWLYSVGKANI